jgi:hypothetical protein
MVRCPPFIFEFEVLTDHSSNLKSKFCPGKPYAWRLRPKLGQPEPAERDDILCLWLLTNKLLLTLLLFTIIHEIQHTD